MKKMLKLWIPSFHLLFYHQFLLWMSQKMKPLTKDQWEVAYNLPDYSCKEDFFSTVIFMNWLDNLNLNHVVCFKGSQIFFKIVNINEVWKSQHHSLIQGDFMTTFLHKMFRHACMFVGNIFSFFSDATLAYHFL